MGFADLSIAEIAEDFKVPVKKVLQECDELGIAYKHPQTRLALEDVKFLALGFRTRSQARRAGPSDAVMSKLMAEGHNCDFNQ